MLKLTTFFHRCKCVKIESHLIYVEKNPENNAVNLFAIKLFPGDSVLNCKQMHGLLMIKISY